MNLDELQKLVMAQALDKGFGVSIEEISVPEKIALLHSEINEAYEEFLNQDIKKLAEEVADILQRALHLAGIFGVIPKYEEIETKKDEEAFLQLHNITSVTYDHWRKNRINEFQNSLEELCNTITSYSSELKINVSEIIKKKIEFNKTREWKGYNEQFSK